MCTPISAVEAGTVSTLGLAFSHDAQYYLAKVPSFAIYVQMLPVNSILSNRQSTQATLYLLQGGHH